MSQAIREALNNWYDAIGMIFRAHWNLISQMAIQAYKSLKNSLTNIPSFSIPQFPYSPIPLTTSLSSFSIIAVAPQTISLSIIK